MLLKRLGFHISLEKSSLNLETKKEFLGLLLDSSNWPTFLVPPKKKHSVTNEINRLLSRAHQLLPARRVAQVAGLCISLSRALGPTRLLLRNLFRDLKKKSHWNGLILLSPEAIQDLLHWSHLMKNWDGKIMLPMKSDLTLFINGIPGQSSHKRILDSGSDCETDQLPGAHRGFPLSSRIQRSDPREDNSDPNRQHRDGSLPQQTHWSLRRSLSSRPGDLQSLSALQCSLIAQYIKGVENVVADRLSQLMDKNNWVLNLILFQHLNRCWGPHSIDCMASFTNHQLQRYNSFHFDPGAKAVDTYLQNWSSDNNYVNPPFNQISSILDKIQRTPLYAPSSLLFGLVNCSSIAS